MEKSSYYRQHGLRFGAQSCCIRVARSYAPREEIEVQTENIGFDSYSQTQSGWAGDSS